MKKLSLGFFRSILLLNENALQDTLRLLTLWFKFGGHDEVSHVMASGFGIVDVDIRLDAIPQIIAPIQTLRVNISRNIGMLLTTVEKHHPQALIYLVTVALRSSCMSHKNAAQAIMDRMHDRIAEIVELVQTLLQYTTLALLVSQAIFMRKCQGSILSLY